MRVHQVVPWGHQDCKDGGLSEETESPLYFLSSEWPALIGSAMNFMPQKDRLGSGVGGEGKEKRFPLSQQHSAG